MSTITKHNSTKKLLENLIREQLKVILSEQELDDVASDIGADLDLGVDELDAPDTDDAAAPDDADAAGGLEGDDAGGEGLGGDDAEGGGLDDAGGDDAGMDFGGGGMGGGFGGGGSGGGGMDDLGGGDDSESGDDSEEADGESSEPEQPETPEAGVLEDVKKAMDETTNPQILLNVAKASIQKYFDSFEQAQTLIQMFQQEQDSTLQDVGRRLSAFLKGF